MARKWPDHFEQQRLQEERTKTEVLRRVDKLLKNIPTNLKDSLVEKTLSNPTESVLFDYGIVLRLHKQHLDAPWLVEPLAKVRTRMHSYSQNFLNLCDRQADTISDSNLKILLLIIRTFDEIGTPYYLGKSLSNRLILAKLSG